MADTVPTISSLLESANLLSHHEQLDTILQGNDTRALHIALKELGVVPLGKRLELAGALRSAATPSASQRAYLKNEGNGHAARGDLSKAIDAYERALTLSDDDDEGKVLTAALHSNLSTVLRKAKRFEDAARAALGAIEAQPTWAKGHFRHGLAKFDLGDASAAHKSLERAHELCIADRERHEVAVALEKLAAAHDPAGKALRGEACDVASPPATPRKLVPLERPDRIHVHEGGRVREHLLREGYVVVAGAADDAELKTLRELLWRHLESASPMRRGKPETWSSEGYPGPAHLGLATWGQVGQSEVLWRARCLPRVGAAFEAAWGVEAGAPLLVSFDGLALFRPPQINSEWSSRPALEWLHVRQRLLAP